MYQFSINEQENNNIVNQVNNDVFCEKLKQINKENLQKDNTNNEIPSALGKVIKINIPKCFDENSIKKYMDLDEKLSQDINSLQEKQQLLNMQIKNAKKSFDINHAILINEKINDLQKQISVRSEEIEKYNYEISEKESEFLNNQNKQNKEKVDEKMLSVAYEYFSNIDETLRNQQIDNNKLLIEFLGDVGVEKLKKMLK